MTLLTYLRDRFQHWRERRDPRVLVRRLYAEGVIDDEMLLAARGQHPSQPCQRSTDLLPRRDLHGQLITDTEWAQYQSWIEITTMGDAGNGFTRWIPDPPRKAQL